MKRIFNLAPVLLVLVAWVWTGCSKKDSDTSPDIKVHGLTVKDAPEYLLNLVVGEKRTVEITILPDEAVDKESYTFRFTSKNQNVFTVDNDGVITATGIGEAALRVDAVNNPDLWTICTVKVEPRLYPVTSIEIPEFYREFSTGVNKRYDLGSTVTVLPENASSKYIIYKSSDEMIATVDEYGVIETFALGDVTITIEATDGSGTKTECLIHVRNYSYTPLDRTGWIVTTSHETQVDGTVTGTAASLIDNSMTSCLVLAKPGKRNVPAGDTVYFIIDMQQQRSFDYFALRHRTATTYDYLRVMGVDIWGSNDGENFDPVMIGADIPNASTVVEVFVDLPVAVKYRYFKLIYAKWSTTNGETMQISNFNIGNITYNQ